MTNHPLSKQIRQSVGNVKNTLSQRFGRWPQVRVGRNDKSGDLPVYFNALVAGVLRELGTSTVEDVDPVKFRALVAMALLGPIEGGLPEKVLDEIVGQVRNNIREISIQERRLLEYAIAYGCGAWRELKGTSQGWDQKWAEAKTALVRALEPIVRECVDWLEGNFIVQMVDDVVQSDASFLMNRLLEPQKTQFSIRPDIGIDISASLIDGTLIKKCSILSSMTHHLELPPGTKVVLSIEGKGVCLQCAEKQTLLHEGRYVIASHDEMTTISSDDKIFEMEPGQDVSLILNGNSNATAIIQKKKYSLIPGNQIKINLQVNGSTSIMLPINNIDMTFELKDKTEILLSGTGATLCGLNYENFYPGDGRIIINSGSIVLKYKNIILDNDNKAAFTINHNSSINTSLWECTCGSIHCSERHRLAAWNPQTHSLWAFLEIAVKGARNIFSGSFAQGMYYPLLSKYDFLHMNRDDGNDVAVRLRYVQQFLFKKCPSCGEDFPDHIEHDDCPYSAHGKGKWVRKHKPYFILAGESQTYEQKSFAECSYDHNLVEVTSEDLVSETKWLCCGNPLFPQEWISKVNNDAKSWITRKRRLRDMRQELLDAGFMCCRCKKNISLREWQCPNCDLENFGQRDIVCWVRGTGNLPDDPHKDNILVYDDDCGERHIEFITKVIGYCNNNLDDNTLCMGKLYLDDTNCRQCGQPVDVA